MAGEIGGNRVGVASSARSRRRAFDTGRFGGFGFDRLGGFGFGEDGFRGFGFGAGATRVAGEGLGLRGRRGGGAVRSIGPSGRAGGPSGGRSVEPISR
jgi:hypothetical protein